MYPETQGTINKISLQENTEDKMFINQRYNCKILVFQRTKVTSVENEWLVYLH